MVDSRENRRTQPHITQTNYIESIEELNKMDIFVCGSCYFVAHFVEEFISHKEMPCERRDVIQPNTSDQKPQVWSFLLWKNAKHRANTQSSSWQLYQEWCTLPDATKNAWIEAGQFLKISSTMKSCYAGMNSKRFISDGILDEEELSPMKATIPNNPVSNSNKVMKKTRSGKYVELIVEKILAKRINNRRTEYWVKYKGRSAADEFKHWEPIESMSSTCQDMISSFESKAYLGQDSSGRKRTLSQTGNELNSAGLLNNVVGNKQKMEHVKQWVQDDTSGRIHGDDDVAKKKLRTDGSDNDSTEDYEEFFLRQKGGIILRASMKSCPKSTHSGGVTKKKNLAAEIGLESEEEEEEGGKENIFGRKNVPAVLKPNEQKNVSPPPSPPPSTIPSFSRSSQRVKSKRTLSKSSGVHDPAIILDLKKPSNKKSSNLPGKHTSTKTNQKKPYKNVPQSKSLLDEIQSDWVDSDSLPPPEDANSVYDQVECSLASMIQESTEKIGRTRNQKAKATVAMKRTNRKRKGKVQSNEPLINKRNVTKAINEGVNKGDKAFDDSIKNRKCKVINENTNNKKEKTMITINNEKVPLKGEIDLNTGEKNDLVLVTDEKSTSDERGDIQTESNENKVNTVVVQKITKQIAKAKTINNEIKNNRKGKAKVIHDEKINNGNNKTIFKKSKKGKLKEPDSGNIKELNLVTQDDENQSNLVKPIKGSKIDEKRKAKTGKSRNCEAIITPNIPNAVNLDDETISPDANCLDKTDEISIMSPKPEETCLNKKMKLTFKEFLELSKQNSWHKSIEVLRKKSPPKLSKSLNSTCPNLETTLLDNSYSSGFKKVMLTLEEYNTMNNNASEEIVQSPKFQSTICQKNKSVCLDCSTIQSSPTNKVSINQHIVKIKKDLVKPVPKTRLRKRKNVKTKICQVQNNLQDIKKPDSDSNISLRRSVDSVQSWWKLEKCKPKYRSKSTEGSGSYHEDSSLIQNNTVSSSVYSSEISSTTLLTASSRTQNITEVEKEVSETCIGNMVMNTNGESCADDAKIEAQNSGLINCKEDAVHEYIDDNEIEPVSSTIVIAKPKRNRAKGTKMKSENIKKISASRKKGKKENMDCEESSKTESSLWAADTELVGEEFLSELIDSTLADINDETSNHVKTETTPNETSISIIETESINVNDMHTCDSLDVEKMFNPSKSIVGNHCSSLMEVIPQNMNLLSDKNELNNSTIIHNKNDLSSPSDCKNDLSLDSCCNDDTLVTHCNLSATETFSPNNTQNVNFLSDKNELNFNTTVYNNKNDLSSTSDCKNDLNDNTLVSHYDVSATETFSLNNTESLLSSKEDFNKFVEDNNLNSEVSVQDQGKLNSEYVNAFCLDFLLDSSVENIMTSTPLQNSAVGCVDFIQQNTGTPCAPSAYLSFTPSPSSNPSYHELRGPEPKIPSYDPRNSGLKLPTVRQKFPVINPPGKIKLVKKKNMSQDTSPLPSPSSVSSPSPLSLPPPRPLPLSLPSAPCPPPSYFNYQPYRKNYEASIVDPWGSDYPGEATTMGISTKKKLLRKRKLSTNKKIVLPSRKSYLSRFLANPNVAVIPPTWSPPREQDNEGYETNSQNISEMTFEAQPNTSSDLSCEPSNSFYDTNICFEVNASFELVRKYNTGTDETDLTPLIPATSHGKDLLSQHKDSSVSQPEIQSETDISALLTDPSVLIQWDSASTQVSSTVAGNSETCAFSFLTSDYDEVSVSYPKLCLQTDASQSPWQPHNHAEQGFYVQDATSIPCPLVCDEYFVEDTTEYKPPARQEHIAEAQPEDTLIPSEETAFFHTEVKIFKPDMPSLNVDFKDDINSAH